MDNLVIFPKKKKKTVFILVKQIRRRSCGSSVEKTTFNVEKVIKLPWKRKPILDPKITKAKTIFWILGGRRFMATANGAKSPSSMGPKVLFYSILLTLQYGAQPLISKRCIGYDLWQQPMPLNLCCWWQSRSYSVNSCAFIWKCEIWL